MCSSVSSKIGGLMWWPLLTPKICGQGSCKGWFAFWAGSTPASHPLRSSAKVRAAQFPFLHLTTETTKKTSKEITSNAPCGVYKSSKATHSLSLALFSLLLPLRGFSFHLLHAPEPKSDSCNLAAGEHLSLSLPRVFLIKDFLLSLEARAKQCLILETQADKGARRGFESRAGGLRKRETSCAAALETERERCVRKQFYQASAASTASDYLQFPPHTARTNKRPKSISANQNVLFERAHVLFFVQLQI